MKKVFLVMGVVPYEGEDVLQIFADRRHASAYLTHCYNEQATTKSYSDRVHYHDSFYITSMIIIDKEIDLNETT